MAAVTSTAARQARPGAERPDLEVDADRDAVCGPEAGEPVDLIPAGGPGHDHRQHDRDAPPRRTMATRVQGPAPAAAAAARRR